MKKIVDARGLACPEPVVMTKKALDSNEVHEVVTIVDNKIALENVSRMAKTLSLESIIEEQDGNFYINITKGDLIPHKDTLQGCTVLMITSNVLGKGDDKLGSILMKSFMYTLTQLEGEIKTLIFLNSGVMLTTAGSELIEHIKNLEGTGVGVISCGTCLDYYGLLDKLQVGVVGNMYTIAEEMLQASKVIVL